MNILGYNRDSAFKGVAAETLTAGALVGIAATTGTICLADADEPIEAIGFVLEDAAAGDMVGIGVIGRVEDPSATYTVGAKLWLSDSPGAVTETKPATATDLLQPVGVALSATVALMHISPCLVKLQAAGTTTIGIV